jgi:monoamine oxidase
VLCIPFTLLRQVDLRVELPAWKKHAIQELGYGTNSKAFQGFAERYWRKLGSSGYAYSDEAFQCAWDNSSCRPAPPAASRF